MLSTICCVKNMNAPFIYLHRCSKLKTFILQSVPKWPTSRKMHSFIKKSIWIFRAKCRHRFAATMQNASKHNFDDEKLYANQIQPDVGH